MTASAPEAPPPALRAVCWGVRGSIPSPGPATVRYGGNTSCLEVRGADGRAYLFDAGTGIRAWSLHAARAAAGEGVEADLFVTHYHWDHIQGLPFCAPLHLPGTHLRVHGPHPEGGRIERVLAGQMAAPYFPVPLHALPAHVEWMPMDGEPWGDGAVEVSALRVRHPGHTCGYRIQAGGATLVYIPDNDLGPDGGMSPAGRSALVEFVRGADVLFHDAMFTEAEYARFAGWGHSTFRQAVALAEEAGVRRLGLFHHAPDRTDGELDAITAALAEELDARGSPLTLFAAAEGEEIALGRSP